MPVVHFSEQGSSSPSVVLLHGFPMHRGVWGNFSNELSKKFRVYTPDLPGFGKSALLPGSFSIGDVADRMNAWLSVIGLTNIVLIGHSLGGYVALAMAQKAPHLLTGLVLFHSTANPDTEEKKQSRNKVLEFIDNNGVETFTSNFVAQLFHDQTHPAIETVRSISRQSKSDTVKGYTQAMRDRPDQNNFLRTFTKPVLFIGGESDAGINPQSLKEQASITANSQLEILPKVAHMGMFENEKRTLEIISGFISKLAVTR